MADKAQGPLDQHPLVGKVRRDPAGPPTDVIELVGFPGDSDRADRQRIYLTTALDSYAEFAVDALEYSTTVPAESSPFLGHEVTVVYVRKDSPVEYTWSATGSQLDEFDLDVQLKAGQRLSGPIPQGNPTNYVRCFHTTPCGGGTRTL